MKKFDWFTILGAMVIAEDTIFLIAQGGWLTVMGLISGGIWIWVAYWDWKKRRLAQTLDCLSRATEMEVDAYSNSDSHRSDVAARRQIALDYLSRNRAEVESANFCLRTLAEAGISTTHAIEACTRTSSTTEIEAIVAAYRTLASRDEVSSDEFAQVLNAACFEPRFIGDVGCKWNARSPYIRCAINPSGECQGCKDYEGA